MIDVNSTDELAIIWFVYVFAKKVIVSLFDDIISMWKDLHGLNVLLYK